MNGFDLIKKIGVKNAVALEINDMQYDLSSLIPDDVNEEKIKVILASDIDGLEVLRHSSAHLLAFAVQRLYKNALLTIGPAVENGFYYDIDFNGINISENDLEKISNEMNSIVKEDVKFIRKEISKEEALSLFANNKYKLEIINSLPANFPISIYYLGDFVDLCRGPHVPSSRYLANFKLTKISGSYWRADASKEKLQRIYGVAFDTKQNLENYFNFLKEAERRDHKKICKAMDLCHFDAEYAPGAVFWHHKGWYVFKTLLNYLRDEKIKNGYVEINTPRLMNRVLWETSGHWEKYGEHNYSGKTQDEMIFAVKPMNCPGGILVYNSTPKSYRDLPLRAAEFGQVNRFESSGSLNGLLRLREFTQDDAHVWCTPEQLETEILNMHNLFYKIYTTMGYNSDTIEIALSLRPEKRIGSDEIWDSAEKYLENVLIKQGLKYKLQPGEGAFYGPKLEYGFKDAIGRSWQIGTIQLDMNLPNRFKMSYIGKDGAKHEPIMIHAACFGSLERFLGQYIENIEGKFPLWHNPMHACILNINDKVTDYCNEIYEKMTQAGIIAQLDMDNKPLQQKIAIHSLEKVPYLIIVGEKEKASKTVSIRIIDNGNNAISMPIDEFINIVVEKIKTKSLNFLLK